MLQQNMLRWYVHVRQKEAWLGEEMYVEYEVEGSRPRGRSEDMERGCAKRLPST